MGFQMPGAVNSQLQFGNASYGSNSINAPQLGQLGGTMGMPGATGVSGGMQPGMFDGAFSKIGGVLGSQGFTNGLGAFSTLANMYTGFKSLGLAKDQLQFQKSSFNKNFNASAQSYNNQLKDRWTASNAAAMAGGNNNFQGMDQWMAGRQIEQTGKGKGNG